MPFGKPQAKNCLDLNKLYSSVKISAPRDRRLLQNHPNPFHESTFIEFVLPEATKAKLSFYDATGRLLKQIEGEYNAGFNRIKLDRQSLTESTNVILYQLETSDYTSEMKRMVIVTK